MEPVTFRPVQRRKLLRIGGISTGFVLLGAAGVAVGHGFGVLAFPGVIGLIIAPLTFNIGYGHTVLSPDGIRTHQLFSRHSCRWPDVTAVDTVKTSGGRGTWNNRIVITQASGRKFRLAAPFDSGNGRDLEFTEKYRQIGDYWARHRSPASP